MPTADEAQGVLAIWHDIRGGQESNFESWYKNEHFPERLAVPGFRLGRRYEAVSGAPRYFCCYLVDTPATLGSAAYIERLNNPTPLTRAIMRDGFFNMNRTACRRVRRFGALWGAFSVTARFDAPIEQDRAVSLLGALAGADGVARCEFWAGADSGGAAATEESLRGRDRRIAACAVVETLRQSDAEQVRDQLTREFGMIAEIGIYRPLCQLSAGAGDA
ncbi:MAG: hypothetical protein QOG38_1861 [Hyphomicrobiales bacterium]|nr:hypothetical protein [Hyphomicrobiales bacterium]